MGARCGRSVSNSAETSGDCVDVAIGIETSSAVESHRLTLNRIRGSVLYWYSTAAAWRRRVESLVESGETTTPRTVGR